MNKNNLNVSVVLPLYKPERKILNKVYSSLKSQKFSGKIEILPVEKNWGMAKQMNYGIKKAKYEIIVTLPQDCIPENKLWLEILISPFKNKEIIAANSKVHLPEEIWSKFDIFAKSLTLREKGSITPLLDEKGTAYRKSILKKVGLFNETDFRTAGEDFDMYLKIRKEGKIAYPDCKVLHIHPTSFIKRLKKDYQYSNGFGALVRIYKTSVPRWYSGLIKALPIIGLPIFVLNYPFKKGISLFPIYFLTTPFSHIYYILGFWKGFLKGKQTI